MSSDTEFRHYLHITKLVKEHKLAEIKTSFKANGAPTDPDRVRQLFGEAIYADGLPIFKFFFATFKPDAARIKQLTIQATKSLSAKIFNYLFGILKPDGHLIIKLIGDATYKHIRSYKEGFASYKRGHYGEWCPEIKAIRMARSKRSLDAMIGTIKRSGVLPPAAVDNLVASRLLRAEERVNQRNVELKAHCDWLIDAYGPY